MPRTFNNLCRSRKSLLRIGKWEDFAAGRAWWCGLLGVGMSTDRKFAQEAEGHNMTVVASKGGEKKHLFSETSLFFHCLHKEHGQLFYVTHATWNKSRSLSRCRWCWGQCSAFPEKNRKKVKNLQLSWLLYWKTFHKQQLVVQYRAITLLLPPPSGRGQFNKFLISSLILLLHIKTTENSYIPLLPLLPDKQQKNSRY